MPDEINPTHLLINRMGDVLQTLGRIEGAQTAMGHELGQLRIDVTAENVRCETDRRGLRSAVAKVQSKQVWMLGWGTGVGVVLVWVANLFGFKLPH